MRVLVCGGRGYSDFVKLGWTLGNLDPRVTYVIHGGARGADAMAGEWAHGFTIPVRVFPADWARHGRRAGPIRNQQMLDEGKPDLVVAFPGGVGTADMVRRARVAGLKVVEVSG